jgi:hypothetical protein
VVSNQQLLLSRDRQGAQRTGLFEHPVSALQPGFCQAHNPLAAANDFAAEDEVLCNEAVGTNVHYRRLLGEATRPYRSIPQFHAALHEVDYQPDHHKLLIGEAV